MKTCYLKITALCGFVLMLAACNKDDSPPESQDVAIMQNDPIAQLRTFHQQMLALKANPELRSQETLPLDEALWDVENHFNMTYSDPEQYYGRAHKHEFTLSLPVGDGQQVMVTDAVNLYEQVTAATRQALSTDDFESKGLVSLQLQRAEEGNGELALKFEAKTGERSAYTPPINILGGPFGVDDDWMYGAPLGKCDDPDIPSGADEQLQEKLFDKLIGVIPEATQGERNIYLDRRTFVFDGHDYEGVYLASNEDEFCIIHEDMNWYYNHEKNIISNLIPTTYHLVGYQPISIIIKAQHDESQGSVTHRNEIEYGKPCRISTSEFGEVETLLPE